MGQTNSNSGGSHTITHSYARGNVNADSGSNSCAGGILGQRGSTTNICYSAALSGSVSGSNGNVWRIGNASNTSNIANSGMTGGTFSYKTPDGSDGADVNLASLSQSDFTALGWDFTGTWKMQNNYPVLKWQQ